MKAKINIYYGKFKHSEEYEGTLEGLMQYLKGLRDSNLHSWITYAIEETDKD